MPALQVTITGICILSVIMLFTDTVALNCTC